MISRVTVLDAVLVLDGLMDERRRDADSDVAIDGGARQRGRVQTLLVSVRRSGIARLVPWSGRVVWPSWRAATGILVERLTCGQLLCLRKTSLRLALCGAYSG
jgi:hypothetical protein